MAEEGESNNGCSHYSYKAAKAVNGIHKELLSQHRGFQTKINFSNYYFTLHKSMRISAAPG